MIPSGNGTGVEDEVTAGAVVSIGFSNKVAVDIRVWVGATDTVRGDAVIVGSVLSYTWDLSSIGFSPHAGKIKPKRAKQSMSNVLLVVDFINEVGDIKLEYTP